MAAKRQHSAARYAEDSFSEEEEEEEEDMLMEQEPRYTSSRSGKPGRPRRTSANRPSSPELARALDAEQQQQEPRGSAATSPGPGSAGRRRGRGPSKRPCLNRNAQMARENRLKKKAYLECVEQKLEKYHRENQELRSVIQRQTEEIRELNDRANHYKSCLNNNSEVTLLLRSLNHSLRHLHGSRASTADQNKSALSDNALAKLDSDVRWTDSTQTNMTKINNPSTLLSGSSTKESLNTSPEGGRKINFGQSSQPKIARKTMPLISSLSPKTEEPSSVESKMEEDEPKFEQSPESHSYCEYNVNASSVGSSSQLPTTPMSAISSSLDKGEASLSETDFSQLSSLNVDLTSFDKLNYTPYPLQLEQDPPITFNEDTILDFIFNDTPGLLNTEPNNTLDLKEEPEEKSKQKTLFNTIKHSGICLHINSSKVTLEYCSKCYENSLSKSDYDM